MTWETRMDQVSAAFAAAHAPRRQTISLGARTLDVLVAETPPQWALGMRVPGATDVDGMLFVMAPGTRMGFHMAGLDYPLAIAFFDGNGRVVETGYMEPGEGRWQPQCPYTYALEFHLDQDFAVLADLADGLDLRTLR